MAFKKIIPGAEVYYSALILFTGAVFTRLYVLRQKRTISPSQYATVVEKQEIEKEVISDIRIRE